MGAFAMALHEGRFSRKSHDTLAEGTVRGAILYVAQTFQENNHSKPTKDNDSKLGQLLSSQYKAFTNKDPKPKQQKALPIGVLRVAAKANVMESQRAVAQLAIGAFFFACRSCEYLKVPQAEKKRTDVLRLRNIRFHRNGRVMKHNNPWIKFSDCVSITFEFQKNHERDNTVTQMALGDVILCPGTSDRTLVSAVWRLDKIDHITLDKMINALRAAVFAFGEEKLGITVDEIRTHSIRLEAVMSMYIRKQVDQFNHNVSGRMLKFETHRHVSNLVPKVSRLDPRQRNHPDNEETRRNDGGNMTRRVRLPAFSMYN
eukprot:8787505-Ditylum_brightwellii.AAC.1